MNDNKLWVKSLKNGCVMHWSDLINFVKGHWEGI
jgi:hypothetical protein